MRLQCDGRKRRALGLDRQDPLARVISYFKSKLNPQKSNKSCGTYLSCLCLKAHSRKAADSWYCSGLSPNCFTNCSKLLGPVSIAMLLPQFGLPRFLAIRRLLIQSIVPYFYGIA